MKFGPVPVVEAEGVYLAHAVAVGGGTLRKGTRLDRAAVKRLVDSGVAEVVAVRLEPGDVHEDEAAARLARVLAGRHVTVAEAATGRANLFADTAGLLAVDAGIIDAVNRIDPAITVATRVPLRGAEAGQMVATVKIIPFAVPAETLARAEAAAAGRREVIAIEPFRPLAVAAISTTLPALKPSVVDKTLAVLEGRLAPAGARIVRDLRVPHDPAALAAAIADVSGWADLTIVFGASAVVDEEDVIPAAIREAGGTVVHLGMPVDPGNLLVLGELGGRPVVGAPGCARSPRENGFDWVLERLLAGRTVTPADITAMGVGGLLMEIVSRPAPRGGEALREAPERRVSAVVLAAGRSSRFSDGHKLLADLGGKPLVRHAAEAALAAPVAEVLVVTGHRAEEVEAALAGLPVHFVRNADYAEGLSTSVRAGIAAVAEGSEAAIVMLGDMPAVGSDTLARLIGAYDPAAGGLIVVPVHEGRRGNPVLWSRRYFPDLLHLSGDKGAHGLIEDNPEAVVHVEAGPGILADVDTTGALDLLRSRGA